MKLNFLIDPGHGGRFTGAVSRGVQEKDINLNVASLLQRELSRKGVFAGMTRLADYSLRDDLQEDLQERCNIEHMSRPDLTISIHCNQSEHESAGGFEIFTSPGETDSDEFATEILESFAKRFPDIRLRKDLSDGDPDKEAKFKILTGTNGPAVLVELCFLSNDFEREWILNPETQQAVAEAICSGVVGQFTNMCKLCGDNYSGNCRACLG